MTHTISPGFRVRLSCSLRPRTYFDQSSLQQTASSVLQTRHPTMAAEEPKDTGHVESQPRDVSETSEGSVQDGATGKDASDDKVAQFVAAHQDYPPMTPEMEKRIKKKIDAWIIPLVRATPRTRWPLWPAYTLCRVSSRPLWLPSTRSSWAPLPCTTSLRTIT